MYKTDLYFEDGFFNIQVEIIKREEGVVMYWCNVYGKRTESYYCIRVDDNPLMVADATNTDEKFGNAVLACLDKIEYANANSRSNKPLQPC